MRVITSAIICSVLIFLPLFLNASELPGINEKLPLSNSIVLSKRILHFLNHINGTNQSFLVISNDKYYIQFMNGNNNNIYCESVSNINLPVNKQIKKEQEKILKNFGFNPPNYRNFKSKEIEASFVGDPTPNYYRNFKLLNGKPDLAIVGVVFKILKDVYKLPSNKIITIQFVVNNLGEYNNLLKAGKIKSMQDYINFLKSK